MKNKFITILLVCLCVSGLYANPVTQNEASQKARSFLSKRAANGVQYAPQMAEQNYILAYACTKIANEDAPNGVFSAETPFFYVFNRENGGFVIVSGDDRVCDILGYSHSGSFDINSMPDNMRWFLSNYAGEIVSLGKDDGIMPRYYAPANNLAGVIVEPLIQTKWNQDYPYNKKCPPFKPDGQDNYVTGCVATAMAQIMKYHEYPRVGTGYKSYILYGFGDVYADFGTTIYDWANMRNTYDSGYSTAAEDAVATLMYHCGVSVSMGYGATASGAQSSNVPYALKTYFGYESDVKFSSRNSYSDAQWENMLKAELDAKRPIYYSGSNSTSGHAFVCDGYDDMNYFHFNWGWSGNGDGYFKTNKLDPGNQGPGGSDGGFTNNQQIVTNIKPIKGLDASLVCNTLQNDGMLVRNEKSNFSFSITNTGEEDYNSLIFLQITTSDNKTYQTIYQNNTEFIGKGETLVINTFANINLSAGSYFIVINYKKGSAWHKLKYVPVMVVENSTKNIDLVCTSLQADETLITNQKGNFTASITNNSAVDYNSRLIVELLNWDNKQTISQNINIESIPAGETKTINFSANITVPAGSYFLVVKYDKSNASGNDLDILKFEQVEVQDAQSGITDNPFSEITLYPNPAVDELFVKSDDLVKSITVFDMLGRIIGTTQFSATELACINVSAISKGIYLLRVETQKGVRTLKFHKK